VRAKKVLPPPGTSVEADGQQIGQILAVDGTRGGNSSGFALVRLDRLKDDDAPLTAGATPVTLQMPAWLGLRHGK
jgi:folate-binding Fe-S cluster repair protein YgfZ